IARVREGLPAARSGAPTTIALHDAQSVVAREYGFASWAELRVRVEHVEAASSADTVRALLLRHVSAALPSEVEGALVAAAAERVPDESSLAPRLPLVPVRNAILSVSTL